MHMQLWTLLSDAGRELPKLFEDESLWHSVFIDYEKPHVSRLWYQWGSDRIYLHKLHACLGEETLYHPHPWPSIMRVHQGVYEMGVGYGKGMEPPPIAMRLLLREGSVYEMTDPDGWHYVLPYMDTFSLMITGKPWDRETPKSEKPMRPLNHWEKEELFSYFRSKYC